ncbi:hypothetical protein Y032_0285g1365 [Ancylostoma ceylanicum]|uniref:Uncharacterized protein n=1 Tax=Ancylostoma ceylanicum TaxID=53326 RepID=A0A016S656_9BILA|nr:hypothetical protein Y032_0285g1365 [Ancylostoma ceylanicum]
MTGPKRTHLHVSIDPRRLLKNAKFWDSWMACVIPSDSLNAGDMHPVLSEDLLAIWTYERSADSPRLYA